MTEKRWTTLEVLRFLRKHTASSFYKEIDAAIMEYDQLQAANAKLRDLGTNLMLGVEEVVENYDDPNWPERMGYSKKDLEKAAAKFEQALQKKGE